MIDSRARVHARTASDVPEVEMAEALHGAEPNRGTTIGLLASTARSIIWSRGASRESRARAKARQECV